MNRPLKMLVAAVALAAVACTASAAPITGSIGFTGTYTADDPDLTLATLFTFGPVATDGPASGSFSGIADGTPTATPATLAVNPEVLPVVPIWSVGGFALTLSSLVETGNTAAALTLEGGGTIVGPAGFDPTPGLWVGTFNNIGAAFTFSASSGAFPEPPRVPDGGTTAALLGMALLSIGVAARRVRRV